MTRARVLAEAHHSASSTSGSDYDSFGRARLTRHDSLTTAAKIEHVYGAPPKQVRRFIRGKETSGLLQKVIAGFPERRRLVPGADDAAGDDDESARLRDQHAVARQERDHDVNQPEHTAARLQSEEGLLVVTAALGCSSSTRACRLRDAARQPRQLVPASFQSRGELSRAPRRVASGARHALLWCQLS